MQLCEFSNVNFIAQCNSVEISIEDFSPMQLYLTWLVAVWWKELLVCWQCGVLSQPLLPRSAGLQQVLTEGNVLRLDVSNVRMDVGVISLASTLAIKICWVATSLGRRWCWGWTCYRWQCGGKLCGWMREARASTDLGWWLLGSGSTLGRALGDEQMNKWEWTNNWQMDKLGRQVGSTSGQVLENEWVNKWEWTNNWQMDKLGERLGRPLVRSWRMSEWTNKNEQTICRWTNTQYIKWQSIGTIDTWEFESKFQVIGW